MDESTNTMGTLTAEGSVILNPNVLSRSLWSKKQRERWKSSLLTFGYGRWGRMAKKIGVNLKQREEMVALSESFIQQCFNYDRSRWRGRLTDWHFGPIYGGERERGAIVTTLPTDDTHPTTNTTSMTTSTINTDTNTNTNTNTNNIVVAPTITHGGINFYQCVLCDTSVQQLHQLQRALRNLNTTTTTTAIAQTNNSKAVDLTVPDDPIEEQPEHIDIRVFPDSNSSSSSNTINNNVDNQASSRRLVYLPGDKIAVKFTRGTDNTPFKIPLDRKCFLLVVFLPSTSSSPPIIPPLKRTPIPLAQVFIYLSINIIYIYGCTYISLSIFSDSLFVLWIHVNKMDSSNKRTSCEHMK